MYLTKRGLQTIPIENNNREQDEKKTNRDRQKKTFERTIKLKYLLKDRDKVMGSGRKHLVQTFQKHAFETEKRVETENIQYLEKYTYLEMWGKTKIKIEKRNLNTSLTSIFFESKKALPYTKVDLEG